MYEDADQEHQNETENARKEVRWMIPVPVIIRGTLADGTLFEEAGTTEDASSSGMAMYLPAPLKKGARVQISVREEGFEASAVVIAIRAMGPNMHRVRVQFEAPHRYDRSTAPRKYIYDASSSSWAGYMEGGIYYNRKHEAFGRLEGNKVVSLDTGHDLFVRKGESFYDLHGNFLGRLT